MFEKIWRIVTNNRGQIHGRLFHLMINDRKASPIKHFDPWYEMTVIDFGIPSCLFLCLMKV